MMIHNVSKTAIHLTDIIHNNDDSHILEYRYILGYNKIIHWYKIQFYNSLLKISKDARMPYGN